MPRKFSLSHKKDFEYVFQNGQRIKTPICLILYAKSTTLSPKFGFIVGKKVSIKAHDRNRAKRQIREVLRPLITQIPNNYYVFIVYKTYLDTDFQDQKRIIERSCQGIKGFN